MYLWNLQLQVRQEKALRRYNDTDGEISQLLARHNNETHVLRERLRRTQERERAAERRWKDSDEQLQRSQATVTRLKKLVEQRELGARDELSRRLEEEKSRSQEAERRMKVIYSMCLLISGYVGNFSCNLSLTLKFTGSLFLTNSRRGFLSFFGIHWPSVVKKCCSFQHQLSSITGETEMICYIICMLCICYVCCA